MKRSGFTMLEVIVVIAIIAILASILFPVFARARERARTISCASNLVNIGLALHMYAQDYEGRFPPLSKSNAIHRYLKNTQVFECPSQTTPVTSYKYQPGLTNDSRGNRRLLWDSTFVHNEGANVIFLSGTVRWFGADQWASRGWMDPSVDNLPTIPSIVPQPQSSQSPSSGEMGR